MTQPTRRRAPAAERTVRILDRLAAADGPQGVSDLARALEIPKSSIHGLCETLTEAGVLIAGREGYQLGPRCLNWGAAYLARSSLTREFERVLQADRRLEDYTVTLSTLQDADVVYLACRNAQKPLGITFQTGMRLPAVYSATGKAMLAALPAPELAEILDLPWRAPFTPHGVESPQAFLRQAERWRGLGYAIDDGEIREGMVCIGAAVPSPDGRLRAGVAISMTSAEARSDCLEALGAVVREIAAKLGGG